MRSSPWSVWTGGLGLAQSADGSIDIEAPRHGNRLAVGNLLNHPAKGQLCHGQDRFVENRPGRETRDGVGPPAFA